jgi:2-polyprenyl-3-methyl-5-hydroxy-6-metoxy-1,4-benzoquinol methylase
LQESRQYWDNAASNFYNEPDHGLRNPIVFEAWMSLLKTWFPLVPSTVLDIGCGTGALSVVLDSLGYKVIGVDLAPAMINFAKGKTITKGLGVEFLVMDAAFPGLTPRQSDAIICRHLLWTLLEPKKVLQRWTGLLKQNGKLILVEGFWGSGGGLHLKDVLKILPP